MLDWKHVYNKRIHFHDSARGTIKTEWYDCKFCGGYRTVTRKKDASKNTNKQDYICLNCMKIFDHHGVSLEGYREVALNKEEDLND